MADNILKNEFMWEEKQEKKKLYKNWKLYAIALGITVIGAGTGLGIYYGVYGNHSEVTKIDLNTLELNTSAITGKEKMTQDDAFNAFLENNTTITDLKDNIETSSFTAPSYTLTGKLVINAKENSKYSGSIEVNINAIGQTKLSDLNLNTNVITGIENMTTEDVFNAFLKNNSNITDLKNNIETGTFTAPSYTIDGSLIINATAIGKYTGTITVSINAIGQTKLSDLNLNTTITGIENMTRQDVFNAFLDLNQEKYPDLETNVKVGTFTAPSYTTDGSLIINATINGKYSGSIKIIIKKLVVSEQQIVDTINKINYQIDEVKINSKASNIKIDASFIKNQLLNEIKNGFITNSFNLNKITINGKELKDSDLITRQTINAKINYNYGSITNQSTNLTIKVVGNTSNDIIWSIINTNYQIEIPAGTSVQTLKTKINGDFIKKYLSPEEQIDFIPTWFELSFIVNKDTLMDLKNSELANPGVISCDFNFYYYSSTVYRGTLTITIV